MLTGCGDSVGTAHAGEHVLLNFHEVDGRSMAPDELLDLAEQDSPFLAGDSGFALTSGEALGTKDV